MEQLCVHRPSQQASVGDTHVLQLPHKRVGGHQGGGRPLVEVAQVGTNPWRQHAHAVMFSVAVEAGVETAAQRDAQAARRSHRRPAKRAFGGDVNRVGSPQLPVLIQCAPGWQAEAQAGVARQGAAAHLEYIDARFVLLRLRLARADQVDIMAVGRQAGREAVDGQGHAVDFRRIGFADDTDAHDMPLAGLAQHRGPALRRHGGHMSSR